MSGVDDIRSGIAQANEQALAAIDALHQAALQLDDAQSLLLTATQGSAHNDVAQAQGFLAEAKQTIDGLESTIRASIQAAEGYATRL